MDGRWTVVLRMQHGSYSIKYLMMDNGDQRLWSSTKSRKEAAMTTVVTVDLAHQIGKLSLKVFALVRRFKTTTFPWRQIL